MPRDGAITLSDLIGKLTDLRRDYSVQQATPQVE
jgi:hypothetical protein